MLSYFYTAWCYTNRALLTVQRTGINWQDLICILCVILLNSKTQSTIKMILNWIAVDCKLMEYVTPTSALVPRYIIMLVSVVKIRIYQQSELLYEQKQLHKNSLSDLAFAGQLQNYPKSSFWKVIHSKSEWQLKRKRNVTVIEQLCASFNKDRWSWVFQIRACG